MTGYFRHWSSFVFLMIGISGALRAQLFPVMDQYLLNPTSISPAFAGKDYPFEVFLTSRIEWTAVPGHPIIGSLNLDGALPKRLGIGGNITINNAGPLHNLTLNLDLAYHLKVAIDHTLSFGLNVSYYQNVLDLINAVLKDPNDPLLAGRSEISESYVNMGASLLYTWRTLDICIAFPLLFNNESFYSGESIYSHVLTMDRNFLAYIGYTLKTKTDWSWKFGFLYRKTQFAPMSFDISALALYKDLGWLGLIYRKNNIICITGGLMISKGLKFNYSYEYSPSTMSGKSYGTHEITLGYQMIPKSEKPSLKEYIK
ncbi:MAG: PorP/SprF family type IX secretion system membrane protein [bacterium]